MADQPAKGASFSFTKICVADLSRSVDFYTRHFGMKHFSEYESPTLKEIMLKTSDHPEAPTLVLMKHLPDQKIDIGNGYGPLGIVTGDIRSLFAELAADRAAITEQPHEMGELGILVGFVEDPDGHPIEIVQLLQR